MTEDELIASARSGSVQAYESLVQSYQNLAWKTALVILRHPADAEDAVQSALVKAWLHLDSFRTGASFRPWLLRIVANEAKNLRLSRQRAAGRSTDVADYDDLRTADPDPETSLLVAERSRELVQLINELPETDRVMIHCRYVLQLSEPEIADVLEIARGTVKSRLHRAIARLRELQQAHERGPREEVTP